MQFICPYKGYENYIKFNFPNMLNVNWSQVFSVQYLIIAKKKKILSRFCIQGLFYLIFLINS